MVPKTVLLNLLLCQERPHWYVFEPILKVENVVDVVLIKVMDKLGAQHEVRCCELGYLLFFLFFFNMDLIFESHLFLTLGSSVQDRLQTHLLQEIWLRSEPI